MTDKEILADLKVELLMARKALIKTLVNDNAQEYFDVRERIKEIELMIKLAK